MKRNYILFPCYKATFLISRLLLAIGNLKTEATTSANTSAEEPFRESDHQSSDTFLSYKKTFVSMFIFGYKYTKGKLITLIHGTNFNVSDITLHHNRCRDLLVQFHPDISLEFSFKTSPLLII